eukprot:m.13828 g.13828  ORF g.13828 m.13828 type:complete len:68 (+) comp10226_c0_seq8:97-300(+)
MDTNADQTRTGQDYSRIKQQMQMVVDATRYSRQAPVDHMVSAGKRSGVEDDDDNDLQEGKATKAFRQ